MSKQMPHETPLDNLKNMIALSQLTTEPMIIPVDTKVLLEWILEKDAEIERLYGEQIVGGKDWNLKLHAQLEDLQTTLEVNKNILRMRDKQLRELRAKLARALYGLNEAHNGFALIAEGEGSDEEVYMIMGKNYLEIMKETFAEIKGTEDSINAEKMESAKLEVADKLAESDVYYNHGDDPIFITTKFETDPFGGPARSTRYHCIAKGQGIDIKITGMTREKPRAEK